MPCTIPQVFLNSESNHDVAPHCMQCLNASRCCRAIQPFRKLPFSDTVSVCPLVGVSLLALNTTEQTILCLSLFNPSLLHLQLGCRFYDSRGFLLSPDLTIAPGSQWASASILCAYLTCCTDLTEKCAVKFPSL